MIANTFYLIKTGFKSLFSNKLMSVASIGSLTACLILVGAAVLFSAGLGTIADEVGRQNQMTAYVAEEAPESHDQIAGRLLALDGVRGVEYYSQQDNLETMCLKLGETVESLLAQPEDNPFLATFVVEVDSPLVYGDCMDAVAGTPGIASVAGSPETAGTIQLVRQVGVYICIGIVVLLGAVSILIVSNTIRLTVHGRRKEIGIMKYVGASGGFIRLPFLVEGMLIGLISAGIALVVLYFGSGWVGQQLPGWWEEASFVQMVLRYSTIDPNTWLNLLIGFGCAGVSVGLLGGGLFIRKYIRV